jgi:hypothetical protein
VSLASYCLVRNCDNRRVDGTSACQDHQREWNTFRKFSQHNIRSGIRRMLQRPAESYAWQPTSRGPNTQQHDDPASDPPLPPNYFTPSRYYCVETICAPCGVIIAWTKFARSESTTNILNFLGSVYPDEESRPDYICIDKACQVLATAVTNGSWETWKRTSRFIVDSYHYNNHRVQDYLCRTFCNPAPANDVAHQENHFFPEGTHSRPWIPRGCQETQGIRAPWSASRYRFLFLISQGQPEVVLGLSWGTLSCP